MSNINNTEVFRCVVPRIVDRPFHEYHVKSPKYLSGNSQKMSKYPKRFPKYLEKASIYLEMY